MTREEFAAFAIEHIPETKIGTCQQFIELVIPVDKISAYAQTLKAHRETNLNYLFCLTASDRKDGFNVIYHLTSTSIGHSVMIRVVLPDRVSPSIASVSHVWKAAEFYEREVFDLFGILFNDHPDLRRIFLDDDWVGYPLRKDYKDAFIINR
jgi:NADH-quinone oxidoreductase subunit C